MQTYVTHDINQINIPETLWNEIVSKNETNTIFQTYQWFHSWWKVFGGDNKLFFITVRDNDKLIGMAPLMITTDKRKSRVVKFVGDEKADYSDFIAADRKEEVLYKIFEAVFTHSKEWDSISLTNVPGCSSTTKTVKRICADRKLSMLSDDSISCPALLVKGYEQYASKLSQKNSLRRRSNYFQKSGKLRFFHITDEAEAKKYLPVFFDQHIGRWGITKFPSLFLQNKNREFYQELMSNIIRKGWLLFSVVEFNDHPIAFHFGFQYNAKVIWYKPSFDIKFSRRSPGKVLIKHLIEYSLDNSIDELDFTVGDEMFKSHFTNIVRKNCRIRIYRNSGKFLMDYAKHHAKRIIRKTVGSNK